MYKNKKISVAMTTYNGERYVIDQLDSIRNQLLQPDEVIICDDNSSDNTVNLVKLYIKEYNLQNWLLYKNEKGLGWKKNFYHAISKVSGDIIFFSDQDDVWFSFKIQQMVELMVNHSMDALYGEKIIIDESGRQKKARNDKRNYTNHLSKIAFTPSFYLLKSLGCCMCVSKRLKDIYVNFNYPEGGHDSQCGRLALLIGSLWHIDTPMIKYRIHSHNTSGISAGATYGSSTLLDRINELESSISWLEKILNELELDNSRKGVVYNCILAIEKRICYLRGEQNCLSLLKYYHYYNGISAFIGDFAYRHRMNKKMGLLRWYMRK